MLAVLLQVLLYAVFAGFSPLAFAATIAVMQSGRPKALAFALGFVLAQLLTCSVLVTIGYVANGSGRNRHPGLQVVLEVAFAVALLWLAARIRRGGMTMERASGERSKKLLDRLRGLHVATTFAAGVVLGIGVPKRLLLAALAATAIATAGVGRSEEAVLVVVYVAVATALVWAPVIVFVLLGDRTVAMMERAQREVAHRQPGLAVHALYLLAAILMIDAMGVLATQVL